jgi:ribosome-associated translation inhibitor RaiA
MTHDGALAEVIVRAHGSVSTAAHAYAHDKIADLGKFASGPVLFAKVDLVAYTDPARQRPAFAKAELDVNGQMVRAHAAATTMFEAVDALESRLRERVERRAHRQEAKHLRHRDGPHEWHHGDPREQRPSSFPRPVEEREIVRRKTFAVEEMTPEEAVFDLEQLDHDFYLFRNLDTGQDNLLCRAADRGYELLEPSPPSLSEPSLDIRPSTVRPTAMTVDAAVEVLDLGDLPFVFFLDPATGRGSLIYRRYDGHYGLIDAAADPD